MVAAFSLIVGMDRMVLTACVMKLAKVARSRGLEMLDFDRNQL